MRKLIGARLQLTIRQPCVTSGDGQRIGKALRLTGNEIVNQGLFVHHWLSTIRLGSRVPCSTDMVRRCPLSQLRRKPLNMEPCFAAAGMGSLVVPT